MRQYINNILLLTMIFGLLISCEQERLDPVLTTAEGGGTLDNYIAYSVMSTDPMGSNVYGRIVFYETTNMSRSSLILVKKIISHLQQ